MKNAILLHGLPSKREYYDSTAPSASNSHWLPWLQKQLMINDIKTDTPEVPFTFEMIWEDWVKEVERFEITNETILVGHSMGAGFWVRYFSEHPEISAAKLVLVAPWLNLDREYDSTFFDFEFRDSIISQVNEFTIFSSDNDSENVLKTVDYLSNKMTSVKVMDFHDYGHFCYKDLKTDAFPQLLNELIS